MIKISPMIYPKELYDPIKEKCLDITVLKPNDRFFFIRDLELAVTYDVIDWIKHNITGFFGAEVHGFYFENEIDAINFKLRWL